jgi:catechol 2,3-dioxygenase-like lactoylglutathione lyase family enzyme
MTYPKIAMIGILSNDVPKMRDFYRDVMGFEVQQDLGGYVEFAHGGVRFAISERSTMLDATGHPSYGEEPRGHSFELAFPASSPSEVDRIYKVLIDQGATPIKEPADMPWGQRTGFFSDPDGNIHEIFANLPTGD